ncbi:MAG TPA: glycosyl hydrolase family 65 protein [Lachnospiraceae bacterium]|nr:glycosyl hydrolase family 65 protein [Lachnospiraceae bacterium]
MANNYRYELNDLSLENDALMLNETVFHNANGYIGVRSNFEEGYPDGYDSIRSSYINGFYDFAEMKQAEKLYGFVEEKQTMLNVADTQGICLTIGDEVFSMFEGTVLASRRYLDMERGYTVREVTWCSPKGHTIRITAKRMTSFDLLTLYTDEYTAESVDYAGEVHLTSAHIGDVKNYSNLNDPRVAGESFEHLLPAEAKIEQGISYLTTDTSASNLRVCTAVAHVISKDAEKEMWIEGHRVFARFDLTLKAGESLRLTKYTVFADSIRVKDTVEAAKADMKQALSRPMSYWYEKQAEYLKRFWEQSSLEIDGDDDLSLAVRYNLYQLIQSVGKDEHSNIAAKGLSGEGYEGHYFWDTEMYMQPFFTLTNPDVAKNLIAYRYSTMEAARDNAKLLGHKKGVLYPWRTIMGKECSGYYPSGTAQYHINGDIAYSVIAYYLATKDLDFIAEKGAEIVFETARLWIDVGNFYKGRFVINAVTGPDEYTCMINNNYFTNASAQYNLHWALRFAELLKKEGRFHALEEKLHLEREELKEFERAEKCMYLPYDEERGINPQDDSFLSKPVWDIAATPKDRFPLLLHYHPLQLYRYQVCKQADTVLAHFIFEDIQSLETIRRSFDYYEKVTTHDSSLSTCIYSIVASKLGLKEKAYDYFGDSAKLDLFNTHNNTKDGIHTANMGGNYMAIVYGFAGLRLKEDGIHFAPSLPAQWSGCRFKINYQGSQIYVDIKKEEVTFELMHGEKQQIHVFDKTYELTDKIVIREGRGGRDEV